MPKSARQAPVTRPTYPVPIMQMFIASLVTGVSRRRRRPWRPIGGSYVSQCLGFAPLDPAVPGRLAIPGDRPPQALLERDPSLEAEQALRLLDGRVRDRDVAGLIGMALEP